MTNLCITDNKTTKMLSKETSEALELWLSQYPESYHPYDMERFYDLVWTSFDKGDMDELIAIDLMEELRKVKPEWEDDFASDFCTKWESILSIVKGLIEYRKPQ